MKLKFVPQEHGEVEIDTDEMLYAVVDTEDGEIFGIFLNDERAQDIIDDRGHPWKIYVLKKEEVAASLTATDITKITSSWNKEDDKDPWG